MMLPSDLSFVLSGGLTNTNPNLSLGGSPSTFPLILPTLFNDIEVLQDTSGLTDYRCFYVSNDSDTDTISGVAIYIEEQGSNGVLGALGFNFVDDVQQIVISNFSTGSFNLSFDGNLFIVNYVADPAILAYDIQASLRAIPGFSTITVTLISSSFSSGPPPTSSINLHVTFSGPLLTRRNYPLVVASNYFPPMSVTISKYMNGGPINWVTPAIANVSTPPAMINFSSPSSPILIGDLQPLDFFPVWLRRVASPNIPAFQNDGFLIRITGGFCAGCILTVSASIRCRTIVVASGTITATNSAAIICHTIVTAIPKVTSEITMGSATIVCPTVVTATGTVVSTLFLASATIVCPTVVTATGTVTTPSLCPTCEDAGVWPPIGGGLGGSTILCCSTAAELIGVVDMSVGCALAFEPDADCLTCNLYCSGPDGTPPNVWQVDAPVVGGVTYYICACHNNFPPGVCVANQISGGPDTGQFGWFVVGQPCNQAGHQMSGGEGDSAAGLCMESNGRDLSGLCKYTTCGC